MALRKYYPTIVLSDIHLGSEHSRTEEVTRFLKQVDCDRLIPNGDIFDSVTSRMRWLAMLGDVGYTFLLWLNKIYNRYREKRGKPYFSLSQQVKNRVKSAVSYISKFEEELVRLAEAKHLDGIICGHIHQAANVWYGDIHYLNSGDWVESMTALVEDEQGDWNIVTYKEEDMNLQLYADAV